jgi:hypothetical protein
MRWPFHPSVFVCWWFPSIVLYIHDHEDSVSLSCSALLCQSWRYWLLISSNYCYFLVQFDVMTALNCLLSQFALPWLALCVQLLLWIVNPPSKDKLLCYESVHKKFQLLASDNIQENKSGWLFRVWEQKYSFALESKNIALFRGRMQWIVLMILTLLIYNNFSCSLLHQSYHCPWSLGVCPEYIYDACSGGCFVLVQYSDADRAYTVMLLNFPFSDAHLYTVY